MSPISHSVLTSSTLSTAKKLKTPLKASVVILTTVILASCGSDSGSKSYYTSSTEVPSSPNPGGGETGGGETGGGETGGGETGGGETGGGETGGGETGGGETGDGETGGGETGGGETGGSETDFEQIKAELEAAKAEAATEKAKAEAAQKEAETAKSELANAQQALEEAEQALEDALASGSGNTEALEKQVASKQKALEEAQAKITEAEQAAVDAQTAADAQIAAANQAAQEAQEALTAAQIKNTPEADKSGVQALKIVAGPLGDFKTITREFTADSNSVQARSDTASEGTLPAVNITTSSDNDKEVGNSFKEYKGNATISVTAPLNVDLPLSYTSTYKDFGDDMRIGHIDGKATFSGLELPVNGAAVIGNATKAENMPTEGTVGYTGDATHRKLGIGNEIEFGSSVFTADFVKKALDGKLSFANAGDINLTAGINGNQFSGAADANGGYATEGGFYGGDAQYLGGVYEGNDAQGTYGAKSDKQTAAEQAAADAQAAAEAAQTKAEQAEQAAQDAQDELADTKAEIDRLEGLIASGGTGNGDLQAQLDAIKADLADAVKEKQDALNDLTAAQTEITEIQDQLDSLANDNTELKGQLTKAQEDLKAAQNTLTDKDAEIKTQQDKLDNLQTQLKTAEEKANTEETAKEEAIKDKQAAETAAQKAKDEAEAAKAKAAKAEQSLQEAKDKIKSLEEQIATGGDTSALEAQLAEEKDKLAQLEEQVANSQGQIDAAEKAAQDAQNALKAAEDAAKIKNAPEAEVTGVQRINVASGQFKTATRDFTTSADKTSSNARADLAAVGILPSVPVVLSGKDDADVKQGFKSHDEETVIVALGNDVPLVYTSVYKDYNDVMRVAHINGEADATDLLKVKLPVDGVVVVGNATKAENMPTEGEVGYTGDATYRELGANNNIEFGSSVFTADFVKKALDGKLSFANAGDINLTAGINGNQFSGAADANGGYATEGGFYGGDAQYLGGVYEGNDAQGTYGAKSDKQTAAEQAAADAQAAAEAAQTKAEQAEQAAQDAQDELADTKAEIDRLEGLIASGGTGNGDLQAQLDAIKADLADAVKEKQDALNDLTAAQTEINVLQETVDGLKGDYSSLKAKLAETEKGLQAQIDSLESDKTDLQTQAEALQAELDKLRPDAPANEEYAADSKITGVQSSNTDAKGIYSESNRGEILGNSSSSFDLLTTRIGELDTIYVKGDLDLKLKTLNDEKFNDTSFSVYENEIPVEGRNSTDAWDKTRTLSYTSIYKNFNNDLQIGHIYGVLESTVDGKVSTVYAQGNATAAKDMEYMQELAKHNLQQGLQNGEGVDSGKVGYAGVSTYQKNGDYSGLVVGTSEFDVDFVNQQLDGTLAFKGTDIDNKKIKAEISGNKFSGNWNGLDTQGGFFGQDAAELGGIYQDADGKGTYGAEKGAELPGTTESDMTGFQSTTLSSIEQTVAGKDLKNAIGYVEIRNDKSDFTETLNKDGDVVPVDNGQGDNFTSFDKGVVRADMVKPDDVGDPLAVSLKQGGEVTVEAGLGSVNPKFKYSAVYKNFDNQMQVGHVYGNINSLLGDVSRAANVYVQGYATTKEAMADLASVNEGKASYAGKATYIENIHLADKANTAPVDGTSNFDVDFVNNSVKGELTFANGDYKYMPEGNKIGIEATIEGNTFAGNNNGIDTAGGFYGDDARFLGGIYQDASVEGGKGDVAGTGTKFQGTFGAEKQAIEK